MSEGTQVREGLESIAQEESSSSDELVFEKCNRFSAAWKFLNEKNRQNLKPFRGIEWWTARIITLATYPAAYLVSLASAKYSPQNMGYRF